ncbi:hypothetical protein GF407_13575 [candidate division KSB1 bacterium]|nr:hypothetical protein [candidate division KSB1 bacterium]
MSISNLSELVHNICSGTYHQTELMQFIHLSQKISLSYLKFQELLGKRITGERLDTDVELEDLAIDCIAELFSRDENDCFPQLKRYYETKFSETPDLNDAEILVLTRRLIVRKTKQELARIFRERDPEGAKIVRNIKVAVRNSDTLRLFKDMGKEYVFYTNGHNIPIDNIQITPQIERYIRRQNPPIPEDLLSSRFLESYNPNDSVSTSIRKLFRHVHELREFQNFIALDTIVKLVRSMKFQTFKERILSDDHVPTPQDTIELKEIENYVHVVMIKVNQKIDSQYLRTGKLKHDKAQIYSNALCDVLYDLIQKKDSSSYFRNLRYYMPHLSQQDYRTKERSIFEYLAKVAKREFRKHLKELL